MNATEVCRTCLHSGGTLYPLFDLNAALPLDSPVFPFIEMLQFFTDIRISYHDGCPVQLCTDCRDDVHHIYTFILKCRRSDAISKQLKDVKTRLRKLRDDSNQINSDNDATENYCSNIVRLQSENSPLREIKEEEPYDDPKEQLDIVQDSSLLIDRGILGNTNENSVDDQLVKVKEEPELIIEDEHFDEAYLEYQTCTEVEIGNDDPSRDVDLSIESLFKGYVIGTEEKKLCSLNTNDSERTTQKPSDSSEIAANYTPPCAYTCSKCLKTFNTKRRLDKHMQFHTESNVCEVCSKQCLNKDALKRHIKRVHNLKYKCDICSNLCTGAAQLAQHMKDHANEKTFKCDICSQQFRFRNALTVHKRNEHVKTDAVLRPFRCEICDKDFRSKNHLRCHDIRIHLLGSPSSSLQCDVCSRLFPCKSDYDRHLLTHTGEKPFKCEICKDKFRYKRYLSNHMQEKHDVILSNSSVTA